MYYFFDESGDWSGLSGQKLVLGGLVIPEEETLDSLRTKLKEIKTRRSLKYLHASDMAQDVLEQCYEVIGNSLESGQAHALLHIFDVETLLRSSLKTKKEVYIELASNLVSTMILGDESPDVAFDMQFYYAYPQNVINNILEKYPRHFQRVIQAHMLKPESHEEERIRIMRRFDGLTAKERESLAWFEQNMQVRPYQTVFHYLWTELMLEVQSKDNARELFRISIMNKARACQSRFPDIAIPKDLEITYHHKEANIVGIELIDILCNLVYRTRHKPWPDSSDAVKAIYNYINLEVIG